MTEKIENIMDEYYRAYFGENKWFKSDKKGVAAAFRELIKQYSYTHLYVDGVHGLGVVNVKEILKVIEELEQ